MYRKNLLTIICFFFCLHVTICQPIDSTSFKLNSRFSFYSYEKSGELLLHVPQNIIFNNVSVTIDVNGENIGSWKGQPGKRMVRIPVTLNLQPDEYHVLADIRIQVKI